MKAFSFLIILLISCNIIKSKKTFENQDLIGVWHFNLISFNNDTIFYRNDMFIGNKTNLIQKEENPFSIEKTQILKESFEKSKKIRLNIINDSIALITKMKSGRNDIQINHFDTLSYSVKNDVIELDFKSKNNFGQIMRLKKYNNILRFDSKEFPEDSVKNNMSHVLIEFIKLD